MHIVIIFLVFLLLLLAGCSSDVEYPPKESEPKREVIQMPKTKSERVKPTLIPAPVIDAVAVSLSESDTFIMVSFRYSYDGKPVTFDNYTIGGVVSINGMKGGVSQTITINADSSTVAFHKDSMPWLSNSDNLKVGYVLKNKEYMFLERGKIFEYPLEGGM